MEIRKDSGCRNGSEYISFFEKARTDHRISPVHISLYFSLLYEAGNHPSLRLQKEKIMMQAKISSTVTYHKCLRELHAYGYINYRPSYHPGKSEAELII